MADMAVFINAIQPGTNAGLLSEESIATMTAAQVNTAGAVATATGVDGPLDQAKSSYGFGTMVNELQGAATVVGHGGAVAGYNAWFGFEDTRGYGLVICRNYSPGTTQLGAVGTRLLRQIAAELR